jgi:hypothetical protein
VAGGGAAGVVAAAEAAELAALEKEYEAMQQVGCSTWHGTVWYGAVVVLQTSSWTCHTLATNALPHAVPHTAWPAWFETGCLPPCDCWHSTSHPACLPLLPPSCRSLLLTGCRMSRPLWLGCGSGQARNGRKRWRSRWGEIIAFCLCLCGRMWLHVIKRRQGEGGVWAFCLVCP